MDQPLLRAIGAINSSLELDTVLQQITESARELLHADIARIALREPGEESLIFRHGMGARSDALAKLRLERGKGIAGIVLVSGQPFRTDDYLNDPRISRDFDDVARQEGIISAIVVPILIDGRVEGVLHLNNRRPGVFTADDEELLVQIAGIAAVAIRNALFATRLRTLARLTQLVSSALEPQPLLQAIADAAGDLMESAFVAIWIADEARQVVERVALRSPGSDPAPAPRPFAYGEGLVGMAARERRTIHIPDVTNDPRVVRREYLVQQRILSVLAVPILFEESLLGVIAFSRRVPFALSPEDSQTLDSFVAQAGIAIRNARLFAQSEERRRTAEALVDVSHALTEVLDPDEVARRAVENVRRLLNAPSAALYRRTPESAYVRLLTVAHDPAAVPLDWASELPVGSGLGALSVEQARPLWSSDLVGDARFDVTADVRERLAAAGYGAVLAVPLIAVGGAFGSLVVADRAGRAYQPDEVRLAKAFADQAAVALENARLHVETERRRRAAEEFAAISRVLTESLDVPTVAQRIVHSVLPLFGAQSSALRVLQPDGSLLTLAVAGQTIPPFEPGFVMARGVGLVGRAIAEEKAVWSADVTTDDVLSDAWREALAGLGPRAILAAPLRADGTIIGVLSVSHHSVHTYRESDAHLLETFADQAAIALRNARVVEDLARTQQQLAHAQKMEAVGQLAGGVAHDFNNLLTVIIGRTDFILDELAGTPALQKDLEIVQSAAARAASLTQQLLAFGRKQVLRPTVLDLRDVVEHVLPLLSRLLPETIAVLSHHQRRTAAVRADRGQIEQVLINLAVNARDAMPSGGRLIISTEEVSLAMPRPTAGGQLTPGSYVVLAVEDSGLGMTAEVQARIFEPFYTTKEVGKGTGLGLSTVYGIVSQHGGGVTVDSAPDHGATFRVYLPADGGAITTDAGAPARPVTGGTETILVVEDQDELRRFVREALERHGYRVVDAATPSEALARGEGLGLDLLLTDVVMPEMNGVETARLLRADRPGLPILYMTGYPREALGSGLPDGELIQKPFTSDDLLRRIRALLDEGGTRR